MNGLKETKWAPKRTTRLANANVGSPTGGDSYGDRTPIVGTVELRNRNEGAVSERNKFMMDALSALCENSSRLDIWKIGR